MIIQAQEFVRSGVLWQLLMLQTVTKALEALVLVISFDDDESSGGRDVTHAFRRLEGGGCL